MTKKRFLLFLVFLVSLPYVVHAESIIVSNPKQDEISNNPKSVGSTETAQSKMLRAVYEENGITFSSTGSSGSIEADIRNGQTVQVQSGTGTIQLTTATASSNLEIYGGDVSVVGQGKDTTRFSKYIRVQNGNVKIDKLSIITDNYGIYSFGNSDIVVEKDAFVKVNGSYVSGIIVEQNVKNVNITVHGQVESNMQGVGADKGAVVDQLVVTGKVKSEAGFGAVSTAFGGYFKNIHITSTGELDCAGAYGILVTDQNGKIDKILMDGKINAISSFYVGFNTTPVVGEVAVNGTMTNTSNAVILYGTINKLLFAEGSNVSSTGASSAIISTRINSSLKDLDMKGALAARYIIVNGGKMDQFLLDSSDISKAGNGSQLTLIYNSGEMVNTVLTNKVIITEYIQNAFLFTTESKVGNFTCDGIIDATTLTPGGFIFDGQSGNQWKDISINKAFLFGTSQNVFPHNQGSYTHITPEIVLENKKESLAGIQYDIKFPNMDPKIKSLKVAAMNQDYEVLYTTDIDPHDGKIIIPLSVNEDFFIANYALDDMTNSIMLMSGKSKVEDYIEPDLTIGVKANNVSYKVGSKITISQFLKDTKAKASQGATLTADLSSVNFNQVGKYKVRITASHPYAKDAYTDVIVSIKGETTDTDGDDNKNESGSNNNSSNGGDKNQMTKHPSATETSLNKYPGSAQTGDNSFMLYAVLVIIASSLTLITVYRKGKR